MFDSRWVLRRAERGCGPHLFGDNRDAPSTSKYGKLLPADPMDDGGP